MPPPGYEPFLAAIIESPRDDGPRLVYSDWLEEQGDPRAEFIRVQMELHSMPENDRAREPLVDRESELLIQHGETWRSELPPWARTGCTFRRGFPFEVTIWRRDDLAEISDLWKVAPVEALKLQDAAEVVAFIADNPDLSRARQLIILDQNFGPTDLRTLVDSPHVNHLTDLRLFGAPVLDAGALVIALSPNLTGLKHLGMCRCRLSDRGIGVLSEATNLPQLSALTLSNSDLNDPSAYMLASGALSTKITELDLSDNDLGDSAVRYLTESTGFRSLARLNLSRNHIGDRGASLILKRWPDLSRLDLSYNRLGYAAGIDLRHHFGGCVRL